MSIWLKKSFFILLSILTFGLVSPSQAFLNEENHALAKNNGKPSTVESTPEETREEELALTHDGFIESMLVQAEKNAYEKFGTKIKPVIEDEFRSLILPKIEKAIADTAAEFPEEDLTSLTISEVPQYAKTEKIFHIYDERSGEDIIRFHVRKDHPPKDGYYFNFHYHTVHDNFQAHHELGSIFWDKNTPPQWMSVS
ncbi:MULTISPECIES: YpjP family protein [unclassified Rossellomorea]|uniref:YpjP family protein n=1 Tax=unclassified Rossellomorea TaxID=2837526 RepID=UPI0020C7378F|nr:MULTISPECIES: YpjP family protein [unclassified Rossellomorea]UTE76069.1 YpjP family protein [Rossellomorea sp. KS-H15a]WGG43905.1 YpjP family protein [Rossellomorea sp. DA94]